MADDSKSSAANDGQHERAQSRHRKKDGDQVYLITGASESVVADSERKNRTYAFLIGVRIISIFLVLLTDGWLQIAILIVGMLAPWVGVQIANNIRQVDGRSVKSIPPQQAALEEASQETKDDPDHTVIVGDFVVGDQNASAPTPSAESDADDTDLDDNEKDNDDTRS